MTEREWTNSTDLVAMLHFLQASGKASDRKLRLFAVACSRRVWDLLDRLGRGAVEIAEQYADGLASPEELRGARLACKSAGGQAAWYAAATNPVVAARNAALSAQHGACVARRDSHAECLAQTALLRDIFGNPFHPLPTIDQGWLSWNDYRIMKRAIVVYEDRRFEDLPFLAEALTDAKCPDEAILSHCRQQGVVHVRGCWAVDTLLEKS